MKTKLFFLMMLFTTSSLLMAQNNPNHIYERIIHFEQTLQNLQTRQVNATMRLDSIVTKQPNTNSSAYVLSGIQEALYDANGNNTNYIYSSWDAANSALIQQNKADYTYTPNGDIASETNYYFDPNVNAMVPYYKQIYTYNSSNQLTAVVAQTYDNTANTFVNSQRETYSYAQNTDQMPDAILIEQWDTGNNAWTLFQSGAIIYNSNGQFVLLTVQQRNTTTNTWENFMRTSRTYDSNMRLTLELQEAWDGSNWVNTSQKTYVYTPTGGNLDVVYEYSHWDTANNTWNLNGKSISLYDSSMNIMQTEYFYTNAGNLVGSLKRVYTYNNNFVTEEYYGWDAANNTWAADSLSKSEYTYDNTYQFSDLILPNGIYNYSISNSLFSAGQLTYYNFYHHKLLLRKYFIRSTATDPWVENQKEEYKYTDTTAGISEENTLEAQVYPVPFDHYIQFKVEGDAGFQLQLMDMNGRVLYTGKHYNNERVEVSGLSKGVYMYKITTTKGQAAGQIIKK